MHRDDYTTLRVYLCFSPDSGSCDEVCAEKRQAVADGWLHSTDYLDDIVLVQTDVSSTRTGPWYDDKQPLPSLLFYRDGLPIVHSGKLLLSITFRFLFKGGIESRSVVYGWLKGWIVLGVENQSVCSRRLCKKVASCVW